MGMDVNGLNPVSEKGSYFRNNCWWWRPLWRYCCVVGKDLIDEETEIGGGYNDGCGLDANGAAKLGVLLQAKIADGHTKTWEKEYNLFLESLPDEDCGVCNNNNRGYSKKKNCHSCDGKGTRENFNKSYPFNVENVKEFSKFLIDSGGFEIW